MGQKRLKKNATIPDVSRLILTVLVLLITLTSVTIMAQQPRITINENNEFGGRTYERRDSDDSMIREYYDDDEILIKEERVFTSEYPIDNGLRKIVTYYSFEKKVREEKIYTNRVSQSTLIERTIDYFDRITGLKTKSENHFIDAYPGYNIIFRENGKKTKIEWYYPHNLNGIVKHFMYFDDKEKVIMVESFYSEKTALEEGYNRRVYYNEYSPNKYYRKSMEEVYYTDEFATEHNGVVKLIKHYHYRPGKLFDTEIHAFSKDGEKLAIDDSSLSAIPSPN